MDDPLDVLDEAVEMAWAGELDAALSMVNSVCDRVPSNVHRAVNLMCVTAARTAKDTTKDEFVYLLREGEFVKIGTTVNPKQRLAAYGTHSPRPMELLACLPETVATEQDLHTRFAAYRERGEWFRLEGDLLDWVNDLKTKESSAAA